MKFKKLLGCVILFLALQSQAQKNPEVLIYIDQYKDLAVIEMKRSGVPASIKLAQGILETQAGKSDLVLRSNNHFGIKCKSNWTGGKVYHDDDAKGECFRSYACSEDSYRDHSDFLKSNARYSSLFNLDPLDYEGWAHGLKKAGYATNPKYPQLLIKTVKEYNLNFYSELALGKVVEEETMLVKANLPAHPDMETSNGPENKPVVVKKKINYPSGIFSINDTKVVFAPKGTSLLAFANQYAIPLPRLFDFNDMEEVEMLQEDQLIYLQRKRKTGNNEFHIVEAGETLFSICQAEAIRLEALLQYNHLKTGMQPAIGEKLYLKKSAPQKIRLAKN